MIIDEKKLELDQRVLDILLRRETEKVAEFLAEQMVEILKGCEMIVKSQSGTQN